MLKSLSFFTLLIILLLRGLFAAPPAWIDLPEDDYAEIGKFEDVRFEDLNAKIKKYHTLPKSNEDFISIRIQSLKEISEYLSKWIADEKVNYRLSFLINIRTISINKAWYLSELAKRAMFDQFDFDYLREYHADISGIKSPYRPLYLNHEKHYDSSQGMYWGQYWFETIDPCHRQLIPYYDLWQKYRNEKDSLYSFFLWLEDQNLSKDIPNFHYLGTEELARCTLMIADGLLYFENDGIKTLVDYCQEGQEYIFNIDLQERIYFVPNTKNVRHVSMSHGKPLLGAGSMKVSRGRILSLDLESGHYLPSINTGIQILEIFEGLGIPLNREMPFSYYDEHEKRYSTLEEFYKLIQKS